MNGISRTTLQKKEFKVLYDALKCVKLSFSTERNALVLLRMCKNSATANRDMTERYNWIKIFF